MRKDYIKRTILHKKETIQEENTYKRLHYIKKRLYKKETIQGKTT